MRFAYLGLFSATHASMPEESKIAMSALAESSSWQIGSVRSASRLKDSLDVIKEILFGTGNFRGVRNLVKAAEFAEMAGIAEKDKEKGIGWDGKDPLDDERP